VLTGCYGSILLKKSALISMVEKYALRLKSLHRAEDSRPRFRIAARKKLIFSGQYVGGLEEPTFSTE
jgi:hypothetical protein